MSQSVNWSLKRVGGAGFIVPASSTFFNPHQLYSDSYFIAAINLFITHPAHERLYHTTGVYAPTIYEQQGEFFYVPLESEQ